MQTGASTTIQMSRFMGMSFATFFNGPPFGR
jgi:hypothetical protein